MSPYGVRGAEGESRGISERTTLFERGELVLLPFCKVEANSVPLSFYSTRMIRTFWSPA